MGFLQGVNDVFAAAIGLVNDRQDFLVELGIAPVREGGGIPGIGTGYLGNVRDRGQHRLCVYRLDPFLALVERH